jgi:hypothetical protein
MNYDCIEITKNDLRAKILERFRNSQHPGEANIVCGDFGDDDAERAAFRKSYFNKHWLEVSDETVKIRNEIAYFSSEGLAFYLPKLLLILLDHADDAAFNIAIDSILFALTVPKKSDRWRMDAFSPLDLSQKNVVAAVLHFYAHESSRDHQVLGAEEAFNSYWKQFI